MAYKVTSNGSITLSTVVEIVADTLADLESEDFPDLSDVSAGSDCIVLENSSVWMLGNDNTWHEI